MGGSEPGSPGVAGFQEGAVDRSDARGHVGGMAGGHTRAFAELWSELAVGDPMARSDPAWVAVAARRHIHVTQRELLALWAKSSPTRSVLRLAVVPLLWSARLWSAFGPAAGDRRPHLLRRLEDSLTDRERQIRAGELSRQVSQGMVTRAAGAAKRAIDDLQCGLGDLALALDELERACVELAALATRLADSASGPAGARPQITPRLPALAGQLHALVGEVSEAANARIRTALEEPEEQRLGLWLSEALRVSPSAQTLELVSRARGDRCLRADALCSLRASWLELAAGLWLIVQALDELLWIETFESEQRLQAFLCARAALTLVACGLCEHPGDFDHPYAWQRQRQALNELVRLVCQAIASREADAVIRCQQLAMRRVTRALSALWSVDEHARDPIEASKPCR